MNIEEEKFFFLRTSKDHYYSRDTGAHAGPKLYEKDQAIKLAIEWNKDQPHSDNGEWEVVPATIYVGPHVPLIQKEPESVLSDEK